MILYNLRYQLPMLRSFAVLGGFCSIPFARSSFSWCYLRLPVFTLSTLSHTDIVMLLIANFNEVIARAPYSALKYQTPSEFAARW